MPSKARQLAQSASAPEGRKNVIINGAQQVAQRSTSTSGIGASGGYFVTDRMNLSVNSLDGRLTMSQDSDSPDGFANSLKFDCTTAQSSLDSTDFAWFQTRIEGQDLQRFAKGTSSAKNFTLSFYVKANSARTMVAELFDADNTRAVSRTFTTTTDWSRIEIDFGADTTGAFNDDGNLSLYVALWLAGGSAYSSGTLQTSWVSSTTANRAAGSSNFFSSTDNTLFITGMQLEVGSVATEFEHCSFAEELAACQRYYYEGVQDSTGINAHNIHVLATFTTTRGFVGVDVPVPMRSAPSISLTGSVALRTPALVSEGTLTSAVIYAAMDQNARFSIDCGFGASTAGEYRNITTGAEGGFIFDAEL